MNSNSKTQLWPVLAAVVTAGLLCLFGMGCATSLTTGVGGGGTRGLAAYQRDLNLHVDLIPKGKFGRHKHRPMRPTYITVHSTQTYVSNANAAHFARALRKGHLTATHNLLGYLTWHFTVDESSVYQSLPLNERGEHADYEGPGNRKSIGIEMCENRGNSRSATVERTAKLVAVLMKERNIPLKNVVPHQNWVQIRPRTGKNLGQKNCPHFLLEGGKPGAKWQGFLQKVAKYRRRL